MTEATTASGGPSGSAEVALPQVIGLRDLEVAQGPALDGRTTKVIAGRVPAGAGLPPHTHLEEQTTYVISGSARYVCQGEVYTVKAGEVIRIPPLLEHTSEMLEESVIIEIFSPAPARVRTIVATSQADPQMASQIMLWQAQ